MSKDVEQSPIDDGIAIIGMSGRFPGAKDVDELWRNVRDGVESISFFSDEELLAAGVDAALLRDPGYVRAKGVLADIELFDAALFGVSPTEAQMMDPQHRLFLEHAFEAMESAGYSGERYGGATAVYAGCGASSTYFLKNIHENEEIRGRMSEYQLFLANGGDFLATRVSYKLGLRGPSVAVQTACSTSLVAVCMACHGLLTYQCDMALAGGAAVSVPQRSGYLYQEGMILSPDGHCRAFDAKARGTVGGSGVGVVVLKRLSDAIEAGDTIHAVIKGSAINNDGASKVGYTAPSVEGQAEAIAQAIEAAEVSPETIGYVEAHGTGTALGDPIEIAALTRAFRAGTRRKGFCAVGSLKPNIGHLDAAAGVAGLIKAVQALKHKELPPMLHFESPNPAIDFAASPFYINAQRSSWRAGDAPRRAGVSSFGMGGTNAHVVLEEAPPAEPSGASRPWKLLALSAMTSDALEKMTANLGERLKQGSDLNLADAAYTLSVGRRAFAHRRVVLCEVAGDAARSLSTLDPTRVFSGREAASARPVVFMFPGQGAQHVSMAAELYREEGAFREQIDRCAEILAPALGLDLRSVLYPGEAQAESAASRLDQTAITQPALVAIEIALARLWMSWGVRPQAMIGHSIGEYAAACIAGVLTLEDALSLAAARGRIMQELPPGAMIAVALPEAEAQALATGGLSLAAVNGPSLSVLSGPLEAVAELERRLSERGVGARRLRTSHAFHSSMMDPVLAPFLEQVKRRRLSAPEIPYLSSVTGAWITAEEATDPGYWVRHLRQPVRFADGLSRLFSDPTRALLEVGPGATLSNLARRHPGAPAGQIIQSSLSSSSASTRGSACTMEALGALWVQGVLVDWEGFYRGERRRRVPLPTYAFERQRCWIDPPRGRGAGAAAAPLVRPTMDMDEEAPALDRLEAFLEQDAKPEALPAGLRDLAHRICASQLCAFLRAGGVDTSRGSKHDKRDLLTWLRITPQYEKFFAFFVKTLADDGIVGVNGDTITFFVGEDDVPAPAALTEELCRSYPDFRGDFELLDYCVSNYGRALSGDMNPMEVLHPDGGADLLAPMIKNGLRFSRAPMYHALTREVLSRVLERAGGRRLKILELGGGAGHLTWPLIPCLRGRDIEYTFTDIGNYFVVNARRRAAELGIDFMRFGVLDVSADVAKQGYELSSYDIVLAFNVVHATRRLDESVGHIKELLAPGGTALLLEASRLERWHTMIWGLEEGLWYFADEDLRPHSPMLHGAGWEDVFRRQGFRGVHAFPRSGEGRSASDYSLIVAQKPADAALAGAPAEARGETPSGQGGGGALFARRSLQTAYVAPRTEMERAIAEVWQHTLGIDRAGVHDNFFELGGDSLIAIQVISRLRQSLQKPLDQHSLLKAPTIASLSASLEDASTPAGSTFLATRELPKNIIELRRGGAKPPLFLVHPAGGHVYIYRELALHLPPDQPVYAVQASGLDGASAALFSVEEMAARYVDAVRALEPDGPYYLGGSSFGGVVAFEMAQVLRGLGRDVALLALLDAGGPGQWPSPDMEEDEVAILSYFLGAGAKLTISPDDLRRLQPDERMRYFLEHGRQAVRLPADFGVDELRPFLELFKMNVKAMRAYAPRPYSGRITFFRARERDSVTPDTPELAWSGLASGGVDLHDAEGNHITMHFAPHVASLAKRLMACLDEARRT
ncbi:beta-ketoacyl synthase N-terminal-like domain-containing protein [Sorangium sp. So ce375]|uniref:type I polyketide synthase n=1 Tax=Sorangium sp. So ce375 TaxID=3133306 RepID=UPI003F5B7EEA